MRVRGPPRKNGRERSEEGWVVSGAILWDPPLKENPISHLVEEKSNLVGQRIVMPGFSQPLGTPLRQSRD